MGWHPINNISITREYSPRQIVVRWDDAILGKREKVFGFDESEYALAFALSEFASLAM